MSARIAILKLSDFVFYIKLDLGTKEQNIDAAHGIFYVWDVSMPNGDDKKQLKIVKKLKNEEKMIDEELSSISELRSYFENEFSGSLETCMNLFWEAYESWQFWKEFGK